MTARLESEATLRTPSSSLSVNFLITRVVRPSRVESMMIDRSPGSLSGIRIAAFYISISCVSLISCVLLAGLA
ncbi:proline-rich receptor-like protein kinase PERK2 [Iris pallida]|uniref:Proline-rich receptor-like protein kinase PERK2 n=1 Tax=Iris pallida TaxID=29817 RepID=A0AAX6HRJ3_IRIPA|nr:proline-rich receptor-like protein kinase PERK2 [Iris pallida]